MGRLGSTIGIGLLLAMGMASIALVQSGKQFPRMFDDAASYLERKDHRWRWQIGLPLRGMPDLSRMPDRLAERGLELGAPVLVRVFKKESELEVWLKKGQRYELFATYPICRWSGDLGPKLREGDKQSPEGFYAVSSRQLNPNSRWHRSFNVGFPNTFDRALGRTGSFIMVHGGCSSVGCFAVTNDAVDEIWRIVTAAFSAGQKRFRTEVYPFRMTDWNMALHKGDEWYSFWETLKPGYDHFERDRVPAQVSVCQQQYVIVPGEPDASGDYPISRSCAPRLATSTNNQPG